MPRVTRAALRSMEQHDGADIAASTPLPQTPIKGRVPLGEIAGNNSEATNTSEEQVPPAKKATGIGKKGNITDKANRQTREKAGEVHAEVLEDESQSVHSSAAEEACQDLLSDGSQEPIDTPKVVHDNGPQTPPSAAANTASQGLSPKPTTASIDSKMHKPVHTATSEGEDGEEDSFVAKIESRTPLRMTRGEEIQIPLKEESDKDDSFLEQIKARTPSKRISRIEDSVEALDVLEEEIEKVKKSIPASAESPVKAKKQAKPQSTTRDMKANGSVRTKKSTGSQKKIEIGRLSTAAGLVTSNPSIGTTRTEARTNSAQEKAAIATQAADSSRKSGQATSQVALKKRISSVHKAPFQPIKSTKPPTRPNFELPGDAVARKLKEQREERSKREEETPKPRAFKARPVRLSHAPEVKLTATTKARLSMAKGESVSRTRPSNSVEKSQSVVHSGPITTIHPTKRSSTLSVAKRSTQAAASGPKPSANSSARLTRGPSLDASTTIRGSGALGANRPAPTAEESAHQKLKGKEVFGRTKVEIMEREKAKKEKEDAARKARADAAERGRIASRAWAEKQKARKPEVGKISE